MLKRKIAGLVIAGLFVGVGVAQAQSFTPSSSSTYRTIPPAQYLFTPSAEQLAAEKSTGAFVPRSSGTYSTIQPAQYFFSASQGGQQQANADISVIPRAWTQFLD